MQLIGFNLSKISAEKFNKQIKKGNQNINFEFTELEKEKISLLKNGEALKIYFTHTLSVEDEEKKEEKQSEIIFQGNIILTVTKEELKPLMKSWKKKQIPNPLRVFLSNVILQKCTPQTVGLQHELNIPSHVPLPRVNIGKD
ncbi:MAG: hypothetical protein KJ718_04310 [Nanoarchaeota archaeon]|nr:hypothetical protein [Nanoarchaeota archaeon]